MKITPPPLFLKRIKTQGEGFGGRQGKRGITPKTAVTLENDRYLASYNSILIKA